MSFIELLLTKKFLICILIAGFISLIFCFLPLAGTLGYEYSVLTAIITSYIAVFFSSEAYNQSADGRSFVREKRSDNISSILLLNLLILVIPFFSGLASSAISGDCSVTTGIEFFVLIPVISVFFSTGVGIFTSAFFGRRGFIVGSIVLSLVIIYSLVELYYQPGLFLFNSVFGYFPGPIYDKLIPITNSLILYRLNTVVWGFFLITLVVIKNRIGERSLGLSTVLIFLSLICIIASSFIYSEKLGFQYSRDYIKQQVLGKSYKTDHFNIYYRPGTRAEKDIKLIALDHEWRYKQLSSYLDVHPNEKITSYIYPDTETRGKIIGAYRTTVANPVHKEIHLVYDGFPDDLLKHELVHVLSSQFGSDILKISPMVGLIEGLAVAADWPQERLTVHQWAKLLMESGRNIDMKTIMGIDFWLQPSTNSYTLMGSFCRFLIDKYGIDRFKKFYKSGDPEVYGKNIDELIGSWKKFLDTLSPVKNGRDMSDYRFSEKSITVEQCPREKEYFKLEGLRSFSNENYGQAVYNFTKAYDIGKNDPDIKTLLYYSYYYNSENGKLMGISTNHSNGNSIEDSIVMNLKANVVWKKQGYESALKIYQQLENGPLTDGLKRSLDIKTELSNYEPELRSMYLNYLKTNNKTEQIVILEEMISRYNFFAPGYYLLGQLFFDMGDYTRAQKYALAAHTRGLPTKQLRNYNLRTLGISLYAIGDYMGSADVVTTLYNNSEDRTEKSWAHDFSDRAKWTANHMNHLN